MGQNFRHEYKFQINPGEYQRLRARLKTFLRPDPHGGQKGEYRIRSVYFDDLKDKALWEKIEGTNPREKFRLRYYNDDLSFLVLEKKSKINGLCSKQGERLTAEQASCLFHGDLTWMLEEGGPVSRELFIKMKNQRLAPKLVLDYRREAFLYPAGNVRVTLDKEIRSARFWPELLTTSRPTFPAAGGAMLMEVKYDQFLPEAIRELVQLGSRLAGSFSKYAAGRAFW